MVYKMLSFLEVPASPRDYDNIEPVTGAEIVPIIDVIDTVAWDGAVQEQRYSSPMQDYDRIAQEDWNE